MCRELLRACAPDAVLVSYRNGIVDLKVRAIGEATRLKIAGNGRPFFALDGGQEGAAASPVGFRLGFDAGGERL
jgi:hypothetical protein